MHRNFIEFRSGLDYSKVTLLARAVRSWYRAKSNTFMAAPLKSKAGSPWKVWTEKRAVDRLNVLLCVCCFLAVTAAINPLVEMGVNDDWSYAYTARGFASTGHLAFNAWAAPILGPQILWGALFIKLFGFSFLSVRLSTFVLALISIPVSYYIARECGLRPSFSVFATLLQVLSPLCLPLIFSFMSDIPAYVFFMLCFYCALKAWRAETGTACSCWALAIALTGVLSGSIRQIYWLAPLLFLPTLAYVQRRCRGAVISLVGAWVLTVAAVFFCTRWFNAQPNTVTERWWEVFQQTRLHLLVLHLLILTGKFALTVALVLLPVLVGLAAPGLRALPRRMVILVAAVVLATGIAAIHWHVLLAPWLGNIISLYGMFPPEIPLGRPAMLLIFAGQEALTMAVLISCAGCGYALWKLPKTAPRSRPEPLPIPAMVLGLIFTAGWFPAVLFRSAGATAFDRYLIPFLTMAAVPLLWFCQVYIRSNISRGSWSMLAVVTLYGVAASHDAFSSARARLEATQVLEHAGIPRTAITAGFEYDGWTQLETSGYINNPLIANAPGAYHPVACSGPATLLTWYMPMMPAVRARYFVSLYRFPMLADFAAAPISYTTWRIPGRGHVFIQMLPEEEYAGCTETNR